MIWVLVACQSEAPWAESVVSAPGSGSGRFSDPSLAVNGARGAGARAGSLDVYSLDRDGPRTELTVAFVGVEIVDGEGPDLVVFENAFQSGSGHFMDPTRVEVSENGEIFVPFPTSYGLLDYSTDPSEWQGFAGIQPVLHDLEDGTTPDPDDPDAGGDRFDLADIGLDRITHVRLTPASDLPADPISDGPDIDAVYGIHWEGSR